MLGAAAGADDITWWENLNAGQGPVSPLPELPTLVLVGIGLVALAGYLWFRGRRLQRGEVG